jgi:SAM-dependent methyltransferase
MRAQDANDYTTWDAAGTSLAAVSTAAAVDELNAEFYGEVRYPAPPLAFERVVERGFWSRMLAQDIGSWGERVVDETSDIWVAGCGTNQALITALKFPEARILGSDLSQTSLDTCWRNALPLGADNLDLRCESINNVTYAGRFDYVLCTGVIHHNANPRQSLQRLADSLTPDGILELMVYNQYHRICTSAFQVALRTMLGTLGGPDLHRELAPAARLAETFDGSGPMADFLSGSRFSSRESFADALLQPIEHSFTVGSLRNMAADCGLELMAFAVDQFSRSRNAISWNMTFRDPELQGRYDALPDHDRWQITNHLQLDQSPMLWFYLQRVDSPRKRPTEQMMSSAFLARRFRRARTHKDMFRQLPDGSYSAIAQVPFPPPTPPFPLAARVYESLNEHAPLSQTLASLGVEPSFGTVHSLRVFLATSAFPFLVST